MTIIMDGCRYCFRECDVKGLSREEVEERARRDGKKQYEPNMVWLFVPGIGYAMEIYGLSD